ncbi:S41 family peptidase [Parasediminibacterium paludis]|uniref:Tricorn protease homolog n=1 Tax=Parasediminibacterium paludis TaxID=908966 RepID=A0ABV8PU35_9BACT
MRKVFLSLLLVGATISGIAQSNAAWLRYPAISPDGKTIAFGYKGDIYRVDASGGVAVPLTIHEAHDMMPVWSHDGKYIAFASDRYGNFDVFVMPATGGTPTRITYNSAGDFPFDFSIDNKQIIFGSARNVQSSNVRFYSPRLFQNLYSVSVTGGTPVIISGAGMERAHYNSKGTQIVFEDRKGYEDPWRKHHTSSVTRDVWVMDVATKHYNKISSFEGEDREPVFSSDDQYIYYLSEKNGNQNIYKASLQQKIAEQQLTSFTTNPVRHLSVSNTNTLCFTQDGDIYTLANGGSPKKLSIQIYNDGRQNVEKNIPVNGNVGEFALSPNGKEIAFVTRGEVFVTSVDGTQTKRITNTPQQERMVSWSADGKTLIYAAERNDNWDIYTTSIVRKEEPYFYAATVLKEEPLIATAAEEFLPKYSPDGKEVAYLENRNVLKIYNIASKQSRTLIPKGHNYSYADGDLDFNWSPDGKYLLADDDYFGFGGSHAAVIKADGSGKIEHPINSGFGEDNPKWAMDGKLMTWVNNKEGRRSIAFQGNRELDIYGAFLDQAAYDQFKLSKDDYALWKEKATPEKKDTTAKKDSEKKWAPDFTDIDNRRVRLTINSSSISDYAVTPDGSKIYYLAAFEKGYDLWVTEPRTRETKILAKLGGSPSGIQMSKDGKAVFVTNNGTLLKIDESGKPTPISVASEMVLDAAKERAYIFEHCWRQVKEKFYDPTIHGIDWQMYKDTYAKFLPHISNNYDFQELLSEMLGELNGSHTGGRYSPQMQNPDVTAALGLLYDETYTGNGLKVTEVIAGGPVDKASSKIKAGCIIEKIDGETLVNTEDWAKYLNRKVGKNTLLSVLDTKTNARFEETVKPILFGEESALMYKRWTNMMYNLVDKLSGGKVGYVHVQGMNDGSYRTTIDEVMGRNKNKEALIVDTRFNGGGWLHNDLNTFLSGKQYLSFAPQGNLVPPTEPMDRWSKPSCVVMSEGNYSDAFIFPYVYKQNGIGKLIGMPVPGTGTAVWWETQIDPTIVFGIPMVATIGKENRPTENLQVEPDMKVPLPYEDLLNGKDTQIEAAVKEMLKTIGK